MKKILILLACIAFALTAVMCPKKKHNEEHHGDKNAPEKTHEHKGEHHGDDSKGSEDSKE